MKYLRLLVLVSAVALLAAACGRTTDSDTTTSSTTTTVADTTTTTPDTTTTTQPEAGPISTFVGADGVETVVEDISRIVSLNGDITEVLYELGLGDNVVAVDVTTTFPPDAVAKIERGDTVGFGQMLTPEAVLRFQPTLVIGDQQVGPAEVLQQLRDARVPVVIIPTETTLDGVTTKITNLGEIVGMPADAADLAERVNEEIDAALALAAEAETSPNVAYIYARGPETIFLFGAGMPTQAMIEGANGVDVAATTGVFGPAPLTPEALIAAAPDVIVLPEAGLGALGGVEALLEIPGISDTPAGQNGNFLAYDEAYFFNLGPRVGQALTEFVLDLHPELNPGG